MVGAVDSTRPESGAGSTGESRAVDLKTNVPHSARIYDYLLGGKDNFPADREAAAALSARLV
jgi:hypothetical protein